MSWIRTIDPANADERLADLYRRVSDPVTGELDNILRIHSLHPEGLEAHFAVYRASMKGTKTLPAVEREMIAVVVSKINGCHY